MKSTVVLALSLLVSFVAHSESIFDFAVYSATDIVARDCDFQGSFGAGNFVRLEAFALGDELTEEEKYSAYGLVGGNFSHKGGANHLARTDVEGNLNFKNLLLPFGIWTSGDVVFDQVTMRFPNQIGVLHGSKWPASLINSDVPKTEKISNFSLKDRLNTLSKQMQDKSLFLARQQPTGYGDPIGGERSIVLHAKSERKYNVFTVQSGTWKSAKNIKIDGDRKAIVVVNILGKVPNMVDKSIELFKGIQTSQILLNFPEAEDITIARSGSPQIGVPTVLAPFALVHHFDNLITGSLVVKNLDAWFPHQCGQVNHKKGDAFIGDDIIFEGSNK